MDRQGLLLVLLLALIGTFGADNSGDKTLDDVAVLESQQIRDINERGANEGAIFRGDLEIGVQELLGAGLSIKPGCKDGQCQKRSLQHF